MADLLNDQRLFTVEEYDLMVESGVFDEDERLELVEGVIRAMSPIGGRHANAIQRIVALFALLVAKKRAILWVQSPIRMSATAELQPDASLLRYHAEGYPQLPLPADAQLVIEVADTSAKHDRLVKLPLYAKAGIPEVWIVDLPAGVVDVFRQPVAAEAKYAQVTTRRAGDAFSPAAFPDVVVAASDLLR